jgi:hypothetical protein
VSATIEREPRDRRWRARATGGPAVHVVDEGDHAVLAASVFLLVLTGMPMRYQDAFWAHWLFWLERGHDQAAALHNDAAVGFISAGAMRVGMMAAAWLTGGSSSVRASSPTRSCSDAGLPEHRREPTVPARPRHSPGLLAVHLLGEVRLLRRDLGLVAIGSTGVVMWFPAKAAHYLPGWVVNAALIFQRYVGVTSTRCSERIEAIGMEVRRQWADGVTMATI